MSLLNAEETMSTKETAIQLIQNLPDDVDLQGIFYCLRDGFKKTPDSETPLENSEEIRLDEMTEDEWAEFVAWGLRDELNDPREDIYTLEDGEPENDSR
jgi:hypothetical protein